MMTMGLIEIMLDVTVSVDKGDNTNRYTEQEI